MSRQHTADTAAMSVQTVTMRFGGVVALKDVSLDVEQGQTHAIIGPNGAGKSTLLNILSAAIQPSEGAVYIYGREMANLRPNWLASHGVARTFQNLALLPGDSVEENLLVGRHHLMDAGVLTGGLFLRRVKQEEHTHRARVHEIAAFFGLTDVLSVNAGSLPYGHRKRVELARAVCMEPSLLLLDEPVAGMHGGEKRQVARLIRAVKESLNLTVIVVEHDMTFIMDIADQVTVLDFGQVIASDQPERVQRDQAVIDAYLGTDTHKNPEVTHE